MTIDERIEALTQSVELLASFHRDVERHLDEANTRTERRFDQLATAIERVLGIVESHEHRIQGLEGGKQP